VYAVAHTGDGSKVYLVRPGRLEVRSSSSLSLLATIDWRYFVPSRRATFFVYSDTTQKLYWFVGDSVLAIDATRDTVTVRMGVSVAPRCACLDHTGRYLFFPAYADSSISMRVCDTRSDSLVGAYPYPDMLNPVSITSSPEQRCIYVGSYDVILVYPDAPPGVEETRNAEVRATKFGPTVVGEVLYLPPALGVERRASCVLLDVSGRKVMDLYPGANDVRALAPGVYFVREQSQAASLKPQAVGKVVITR
jgi:DNA-binding beta-propeller fold protein YncE